MTNRMVFRLTAVVAILAMGGFATAPASAAAASAQAAGQVASLRAAVAALESGGLGSYAGKLESVVDEINAWAAGNGGLTGGLIAKLDKARLNLAKGAKMWRGAGKLTKAGVLSKQEKVVQGVIDALKLLLQEQGGASASVSASHAGPSGPTLTVELKSGTAPSHARTTPPPARKAPPRKPARLQGRGADRAAQRERLMGMQYSGGIYGSGAASAKKSAKSTSKSSGRSRSADRAVNGGEGLTIILRESGLTFDGVDALRSHVRAKAASMGNRTIVFQIDPDIAWKDVSEAVTVFTDAGLNGDIRFAGLSLSPGGAAVASTPAAAVDSTPKPAMTHTTPMGGPAPSSFGRTPSGPVPAAFTGKK